MMGLAGNRSRRLHLFRVDRDTWENAGEVPLLRRASVDRSDSAECVQGGVVAAEGALGEGYIRLVLDTDAADGFGRSDVATLYAATPRTVHGFSGSSRECECECTSVLFPAACAMLPPGWFFPAGGDPVAGALQLLRERIHAPVAVVCSDARTTAATVAQDGETALSMARLLLDGAGWRIDIDGRGTVSAAERARAADSVLGPGALSGDIAEECDIYDVPNVMLVTDGAGNYREARNEDGSSETSIAALGFEKWAFEQVSLAEGETLLDRAWDALDRASAATRTISYQRDFDPDIREGMPVRIRIPQMGIDGVYTVATQTIAMDEGSHGLVVTETAAAYIDTFRR